MLILQGVLKKKLGVTSKIMGKIISINNINYSYDRALKSTNMLLEKKGLETLSSPEVNDNIKRAFKRQRSQQNKKKIKERQFYPLFSQNKEKSEERQNR